MFGFGGNDDKVKHIDERVALLEMNDRDERSSLVEKFGDTFINAVYSPYDTHWTRRIPRSYSIRRRTSLEVDVVNVGDLHLYEKISELHAENVGEYLNDVPLTANQTVAARRKTAKRKTKKGGK